VDPMGFGGAAPFHNVKTIEQEFASFGHGLAVKPKILAVTKADLPGADKVHRDLARRLGRRGPVHLVSGVTGAGMQGLLDAVLKALRDAPDPPPAPVETPEPAGFRMEGLDVESLGEGLFDIRGEEAERLARMTNFGQPEAVRRFQNILKVMGVERRLKALGVRTGDSVRLGGIEFGWGEAPPPRGRDLPRRKPRPAQPR